jgi:ApbE superfamily uncharacterized protein (UPF0280 family)|tara:strand:- start:434 stop:1285 length:852 start_codon:yes stop_codon:yes gene_type:complete
MADNRLHLQHGPIDLILHVDASEEIRKRLYSTAKKRFSTVLQELVVEMDLLKQPWSADLPDPKGGIAQKMCFAVRGSDIFVTPMASVAGAVADEVLEAMLYEAKNPDPCLEEIQRMYVNNGGDIAFWLNAGESFSIGVVDNPGIPELNARVSLAYESPVRGIATSGWRGRSQSLGIADAVTVLAGSAATADAAATLIANDVNVYYPGILKRPASEVKDESDLGMLPVTVDVPPLPVDQISEALKRGAQTAGNFIRTGKIEAAYLSLQKQTLVVENNLKKESNE